MIKINSKGQNTLGHTAPFPSEIPEYATQVFTGVNDTVLDPFAGAFTTTIESFRQGRNSIGIELHKTMFRKAVLDRFSKTLKVQPKRWTVNESEDRNKQVIGLYGEMRLAMELHNRGWQVYRAYIDEKIDFVIMKSYCKNCEDFREALIRRQHYKGKNRKAVTQLCEECEQDSLKMLVRFIQVKTSDGKPQKPTKSGKEKKGYSFHPKIRYHLKDGRVFYVWIQVWNADTHNINYFIFKTEDVELFDSLDLDTYQNNGQSKNFIADNQKRESGKTGKNTTKWEDIRL